MKKSIFFLAAFCLSITQFYSQQETKDPVIKEGDNAVNIYYGTNVLGSVYRQLLPELAIGIKTKSFGNIGLVYERMLTDIIGVGVEFGYVSSSFYFQQEYVLGNGQTELFDYGVTVKTIRAMGRANFHFSESEKFDFYAFASAGLRYTKLSIWTSNNYDSFSFAFRSPLPFGVKPGIGLRYFLIPEVGIQAEFALGSPLFCGGLSFKF